MVEKELTVSITDGPIPIIHLSGQVDYRNRGDMCRAIEGLFENGREMIKADLSELNYMDSSAVSSLIKCAVHAAEHDGSIELTGVPPHISRFLTLCGAAVFFRSVLPEMPCFPARSDVTNSRTFWNVSQLKLKATPEYASMARKRIMNVVESIPISDECRNDILYSVGEALSNAIKHGCKCDQQNKFSVKCIVGPRKIVIEISDPGTGFDPDAVPDPELTSIVRGGLGIYIMRGLMDEVTYDFSKGTKVRLAKNLALKDQSDERQEKILGQAI